MEGEATSIPVSEALAEIERVLDRVDRDRSGLDASARLGAVRSVRRVAARVDALKAVLTAEADRTRASEAAAGTGLASWLGMGETLSRREAAGAVRQARVLGQHRLVGEAAVAGRVGPGQARAITGVLDGLAPQLDGTQQAAAEQVLVELAGHLDAEQLSKAAGQVLARVVPGQAEDALELHLQRQAEAAHRQRSLRFFMEGASVRFDGSLPRPDAERWIAQLDAHAEHARRTALARRDPFTGQLTPEQRRADALIALIRAGDQQARPRVDRDSPAAPPDPGPTSDDRLPVPDDRLPVPDDRVPAPTGRVLVLLDHDRLVDGAAGAGVLPDGQPLSAGELRRICCDAEIVPIVLGSPSEVLDVGRAERLVTPALRIALIVRDRGCGFPGCDAPPGRCEAHHVVPWWAGGATDLSNLVLLCHSHHPVVEPARHGLRDQWQVRLREGVPEFIPPARLDPTRAPIRHDRHHPPEASDRETGPPPQAA
jgi:hypothetical protein